MGNSTEQAAISAVPLALTYRTCPAGTRSAVSDMLKAQSSTGPVRAADGGARSLCVADAACSGRRRPQTSNSSAFVASRFRQGRCRPPGAGHGFNRAESVHPLLTVRRRDIFSECFYIAFFALFSMLVAPLQAVSAAPQISPDYITGGSEGVMGMARKQTHGPEEIATKLRQVRC
jgi:hypothetical protein